jgi:hypothetical protein
VKSLNRIARRWTASLGLIVALIGLNAVPALAAPVFGVQLARYSPEIQLVEVRGGTGGQYRLSFGSGGPGVSETANLKFNANSAELQAALNALANINAGGGSVTVSGNPGGLIVLFDGGPLANTDVPLLTASNGTVPLSGGGARVVARTVYTSDVSRSDQRLDYLVTVKNNGSITAGSTLVCAPKTWTNGASFAYQWLRDGSSLGAANGAQTTTYTLQGSDPGHSIQCQVTATNAAATTSSAALSAPLVVLPVPSPAPPRSNDPAVGASRPTISTVESTKRLCTPPTNWSGAPLTWSFQWLRNGAPIAGAIAEKYTPETAGADKDKVLQCMATATNSGGKAAGISNNENIGSPPTPPQNTVANSPQVGGGSEWTNGKVTAEVKLPAGLQTSVLRTAGTGWTCVNNAAVGIEPAKAECSREDALAPGASYPMLIVSARMGADAPDHATAVLTVSGGGAANEGGLDEFDFTPAKPFGFEWFDSEIIDVHGHDFTQAGGHPFSSGVTFDFNTKRHLEGAQLPFQDIAGDETIETARQVMLDLPRGFVANALAVPTLCAGVADVIAKTCPAGSAVGLINVDIIDGQFANSVAKMPIFAIEPEYALPAQFAFAETSILNSPFTLSPHLRAEDGYAISLNASPASGSTPLRSLHEGLFCGFGAKVTGNAFEGCKEATDPTANPLPLVTNPTRCTGAPPTVQISADSWEHPGVFVGAETSDPLPTGCQSIDFQPEVSVAPTNKQADTPTGVNVEITMPTDGLESKTGLSQAALDNAIVTFPKGMSLNPAASHGLKSCTPAQVKLGSNADDECPLASQVGTIEIDTPLIQETLTGHVFVASQGDNPFKSTIGIYLIFSSPKDGITVKVPGKLEADPVTGQLTSSFAENPEFPFSRVAIKFNSGPRAPLINPPKCGTYAIHSEMSPWSAASPANPTAEEIVAADSVYEVTSGPNGAPCPTGALNPSFEAGLKNAAAGGKSPFVMKLSREDGSDRFTGLDLRMPPGLTAYLKGIPYCPDHVLSGISGAELAGQGELASPACPAASQIGSINAGAGAGPYPFYAPGRAFLAGPYKGAPLSIVVVTPAVAGPFDLGNVVVRNALYVDPVTAQVSVVSDPIPTILHGILLDVRDLRINIDRQGFTAAPTNCDVKSIDATVRGLSGAVVKRSNRFQVGDCAALGFQPKLHLRLFGGTKRGAHPKLRAIVKTRSGDANFAGASVALPHSEFLEQAHIRTICTRVQFAADQCPAAAIYGHAEATSPLLDSKLSGPVYLRSSSNPLPDLVAVVRGPATQPIEVELVGRIDSVNGGIRSTFDFLPDQPVSSFTLTMQGGKKGLLVNSRELCTSVNKATARFTGQNGKTSESRPVLKSACDKGKTQKGKKQKRRSGR